MSGLLFLPIIARGQPGDPFFSSVVQLAHFHGANGSQTFTNSCPRGTTITANGTDALSNAQFVFGPTSLRRGSSTGNTQERAAGSADYQFGTSDFTIEFRYRVDTIALKNIIDMRINNSSTAAPSLFLNVGGTLNYYVNNTTQMSTGNVIAATTWYAIAICRVGATTRIFVDGVSQASFADSINYNFASTDIYISQNPSSGNDGVNFYMEELRVTNGVGRYSATYTPSGQPFPNH